MTSASSAEISTVRADKLLRQASENFARKSEVQISLYKDALEKLKAIPDLSLNLKAYRIIHPSIAGNYISFLKEFPNLRSLACAGSGAHFNEFIQKLATGCPAMKSFNIHIDSIPQSNDLEDLCNALSSYKQLESLTISFNSCSIEKLSKAFVPFEKCSRLKVIKIDGGIVADSKENMSEFVDKISRIQFLEEFSIQNFLYGVDYSFYKRIIVDVVQLKKLIIVDKCNVSSVKNILKKELGGFRERCNPNLCITYGGEDLFDEATDNANQKQVPSSSGSIVPEFSPVPPSASAVPTSASSAVRVPATSGQKSKAVSVSFSEEEIKKKLDIFFKIDRLRHRGSKDEWHKFKEEYEAAAYRALKDLQSVEDLNIDMPSMYWSSDPREAEYASSFLIFSSCGILKKLPNIKSLKFYFPRGFAFQELPSNNLPVDYNKFFDAPQLTHLSVIGFATCSVCFFNFLSSMPCLESLELDMRLLPFYVLRKAPTTDEDDYLVMNDVPVPNVVLQLPVLERLRSLSILLDNEGETGRFVDGYVTVAVIRRGINDWLPYIEKYTQLESLTIHGLILRGKSNEDKKKELESFVAALKKIKNLKKLTLRECSIFFEGAEEIINSLIELFKSKDLDLRYCPSP